MGGLRGVKHYLQRTAIQGSPSMITAITNVYQQHAKGITGEAHPFTKYFEELQIGDVLALAGGTSSSGVDPSRLFPGYLAAVEQLSHFIDSWKLA